MMVCTASGARQCGMHTSRATYSAVFSPMATPLGGSAVAWPAPAMVGGAAARPAPTKAAVNRSWPAPPRVTLSVKRRHNGWRPGNNCAGYLDRGHSAGAHVTRGKLSLTSPSSKDSSPAAILRRSDQLLPSAVLRFGSGAHQGPGPYSSPSADRP